MMTVEGVCMAGRWADILRILGRALDNERGTDVLVRGGDVVDVSWKQDGATHRSFYDALDMTKLREQAPLMRQPIAMPPKGEREELLRTLGQELDDQQIADVQIEERAGSFEVRGQTPEGAVYRFYSSVELRELSRKRRASRGTPARVDGSESRSSNAPVP
jgi:hypothetical protein